MLVALPPDATEAELFAVLPVRVQFHTAVSLQVIVTCAAPGPKLVSDKATGEPALGPPAGVKVTPPADIPAMIAITPVM
jgi:hypothetical protein